MNRGYWIGTAEIFSGDFAAYCAPPEVCHSIATVRAIPEAKVRIVMK